LWGRKIATRENLSTTGARIGRADRRRELSLDAGTHKNWRLRGGNRCRHRPRAAAQERLDHLTTDSGELIGPLMMNATAMLAELRM
jgi:hypothetical protein